MTDHLGDTFRDFMRVDVDPVLAGPDQIYRRARLRTVRSRIVVVSAAVAVIAGAVPIYNSVTGNSVSTAPAPVAEQPVAPVETADATPPNAGPTPAPTSGPTPGPTPGPTSGEPAPSTPAARQEIPETSGQPATGRTSVPTGKSTTDAPAELASVDFLVAPADLAAAFQPIRTEDEQLTLRRRSLSLAGCEQGAKSPPALWRSMRQDVPLGSYLEQYVIPYPSATAAEAAVERMADTASTCKTLDVGTQPNTRIQTLSILKQDPARNLLWIREGLLPTDENGRVMDEIDPQADWTVVRVGSTVVIGMGGKHHNSDTLDVAEMDRAIRAIACGPSQGRC